MFSLTLASLDLLLDGCNNWYSTHRLCFGLDKISPAVGNRVDSMSVVARWESEAVVVVSVVSPAAHCRFVCENLKEKQAGDGSCTLLSAQLVCSSRSSDEQLKVPLTADHQQLQSCFLL